MSTSHEEVAGVSLLFAKSDVHWRPRTAKGKGDTP
jgi:hypothetical protein